MHITHHCPFPFTIGKHAAEKTSFPVSSGVLGNSKATGITTAAINKASIQCYSMPNIIQHSFGLGLIENSMMNLLPLPVLQWAPSIHERFNNSSLHISKITVLSILTLLRQNPENQKKKKVIQEVRCHYWKGIELILGFFILLGEDNEKHSEYVSMQMYGSEGESLKK